MYWQKWQNSRPHSFLRLIVTPTRNYKYWMPSLHKTPRWLPIWTASEVTTILESPFYDWPNAEVHISTLYEWFQGSSAHLHQLEEGIRSQKHIRSWNEDKEKWLVISSDFVAWKVQELRRNIYLVVNLLAISQYWENGIVRMDPFA